MLRRFSVSLPTLILLTASFAGVAQADELTKERIRDTASRIVQDIGESSTSDQEQRQILQDLRLILSQVRSGNGGGGPNNGNDLFCKPWSSSMSYVARRSDGTQLGDRVSNELCQQLVASARVGLACEPWSSSMGYITEVATGEHIGDRGSFEQCKANIAVATRALVCSPWSSSTGNIFSREKKANIGDRVDMARCNEVTTKAKRGLVCEPWSSSLAYITRIATGEHLGDRVSFEQCFQSL